MTGDFTDIKNLEKEKNILWEEMGKHPEKEQELAQLYFSIDKKIIDIYKSFNNQ